MRASHPSDPLDPDASEAPPARAASDGEPLSMSPETLVENLPGLAAVVHNGLVVAANARWLETDRSALLRAVAADPHHGRPVFGFDWALPPGPPLIVRVIRVGAPGFDLVSAVDQDSHDGWAVPSGPLSRLSGGGRRSSDWDLVDNLEEGVIIRDSEGRLRTANQAARTMLGLTRREIELRQPPAGWLALREDGTPFLDHEIPGTELMRTGRRGTESVAVSVRRADGTVSRLRVRSHILGWRDDGRPVAVMVTLNPDHPEDPFARRRGTSSAPAGRGSARF